ncbi:MAG: CPBP family intramembrane metalloprotease [Acidobacteria bacterium]|nr:MAG: CPBP family intramembrane metalloprotease [Acidobacteriota bacterium]
MHLPFFGEVLFPWVYVLLASIAGVFYGLAYVKRAQLTTAALVHAMVDLWWSLFFHG